MVMIMVMMILTQQWPQRSLIQKQDYSYHKFVPIFVIVCCEDGIFTFHISLTGKLLLSASGRSMYPFNAPFSLSARKKKIDEAALEMISTASAVRGKT